LFRIPVVLIKSTTSGEMDYEDFRAKLLQNRSKPAIVSINIGTTVKGAVDSLAQVKAALADNNFTKENSFIHADGALAGLMLPFLGNDLKDQKDLCGYQVTFEKGIDSISVSGHKMLGCPMPCGVVITRKEHMQRFAKTVRSTRLADLGIFSPSLPPPC
jgi:histidine decarboxylase